MAGGFGNAVNSVVDAAMGTDSGTNLLSFLLKFSSSEAKFVNTINPLATFDAKIKFYPTINPTKDTRSVWEKVGAAAANAGLNALNNLANNVTGGLLGSLLNAGHDVQQMHDDFKEKGEHSFIEYLAEANLIVGGENWFKIQQSNCPLELQLGYYVLSATIPKLKIPDGGKSTTFIGEFPINGTYVIPDNNQLQLDILCTKLPLHERLFYPWMREVTLPYWSYASLPYTTATITIDFSKHTDILYVFHGCRPTAIDMILPTLSPDATVTRLVTFIFDFMFVTSKKLPVMESVIERLMSSGKALFNGATTILNMK